MFHDKFYREDENFSFEGTYIFGSAFQRLSLIPLRLESDFSIDILQSLKKKTNQCTVV